MRSFTHPALFFLLLAAPLHAQTVRTVTLTVVDENSIAVPDAQVSIEEPGHPALQLATDYSGRASFALSVAVPYRIGVRKPGFFQAAIESVDPADLAPRVVLNHEQMVVEQVSVSASPPGIDTERVSDRFTMNLPEIVNIPYPTSRDIRNLLPFYPGVVQDNSGQAHVAGSETWMTLDTLDGFDLRSPVDGQLSLRFSADAVRSIDAESTRYPVEFGRATGGVFAFASGMGDNRFRFNATNFIPSLQDKSGIRFDKFVPRVTFSGPIRRNRAWFFDGADAEFTDTYIPGLPGNADTNHFFRASNLLRFQANLTPSDILSAGLLVNDMHSPYDNLSPLVPQASTTNHDTIAWLPYTRFQHSFPRGALVDVGFGVLRYRDGNEPHPGGAYQLTPEVAKGSYFENLTTRSQRFEGNAALYLPPRRWLGVHDFKAGIDLDQVRFTENPILAPIEYLREDGTLLRRSVFPAFPPFTRHNAEIGAYIQDRWTLHPGLLVEPGFRFDWDEIIRRPLPAPRLAAVYAPQAAHGRTKISAGVGLYFEHTQLEYLARALAGQRFDTYFAAAGVTPAGPPVETTFSAADGSLRQARALNWSVEAEQRLPAAIDASASYTWKRLTDVFTYANPSHPTALSGSFILTNNRTDNDHVFTIQGRRNFTRGYTLFAAYTRSSAHTNAALDYNPAVSLLGPQQSGPLPWDSPNRVISWGWLPFLIPGFKKNWDFVYTLDWHTGFPYTAIDANHQVVGLANSYRYPDFTSFSPGLEWRFHFHGKYFGLRGVMENATDSGNYAVVNNVVDSPQFGRFTVPLGRALTARLRLIGEGH